MRLEQNQNQRLEQRQELRLTQQLLQKLELLQVPILELRELVEQELEVNPILELKEEIDEPEQESENCEIRKDGDKSEMLDEMEEHEKEWTQPERKFRASYDEEDESRLEMLANIEANNVTLQEHLSKQLSLMDIPQDIGKIIEFVIGNLDEDGYFRIPLEEVQNTSSKDEQFKDLPPEILQKKIEDALSIVQKLEPHGVGARNTTECILLQLPEDTPFYEIKKRLIEEHLDNIAHNNLPAIAKAMLLDQKFLETFELSPFSDVKEVIETIKMLLEDLKHLNLKPGQDFAHGKITHIIPEITIKELEDGRYEIMFNDAYVPEVSVNLSYKKVLKDPNATEEQKDFIRKKLAGAKSLVQAIKHRRDLIYKLVQRIVEYQKGFLKNGIEYIKPLKMKTLANELGVHISTISRAANQKYVQTPRGIFSLKFFFASAASRAGLNTYFTQNNQRARLSILDKISEILTSEDKRKPLSDNDIVKLLQQQGINIARRTVAKYRSQLGATSSKIRKQY